MNAQELRTLYAIDANASVENGTVVIFYNGKEIKKFNVQNIKKTNSRSVDKECQKQGLKWTNYKTFDKNGNFYGAGININKNTKPIGPISYQKETSRVNNANFAKGSSVNPVEKNSAKFPKITTQKATLSSLPKNSQPWKRVEISFEGFKSYSNGTDLSFDDRNIPKQYEFLPFKDLYEIVEKKLKIFVGTVEADGRDRNFETYYKAPVSVSCFSKQNDVLEGRTSADKIPTSSKIKKYLERYPKIRLYTW